jgi:hypothetical protein
MTSEMWKGDAVTRGEKIALLRRAITALEDVLQHARFDPQEANMLTENLAYERATLELLERAPA